MHEALVYLPPALVWAAVAYKLPALVRRPRLQWADVLACEWIVYPQETALRPLFEGLLAEAASRESPAAIETASVVATTMLLERTDMLAVMPRDVAEHYARRRMLAILPLKVPAKLAPLGIVRHADRELSEAAHVFIDQLRAIATERARPKIRRVK